MVPIALLAFFLATYVCIMYLPPWTLSVLAVIAFIGFKMLIRQMFMMPFKLKSSYLRGAALQVHSIEKTTAPPREKTAGDEAPAPSDYYWADITIAPRPTATKMTAWDPSDLILVKPGKDPMQNEDGDSEGGIIEQLEIFDGTAFKTEEGMKYPDAQRMRLLLAVPPKTQSVVLHYYFENLGTLSLG
jgi:hypothetical protein